MVTCVKMVSLQMGPRNCPCRDVCTEQSSDQDEPEKHHVVSFGSCGSLQTNRKKAS